MRDRVLGAFDDPEFFPSIIDQFLRDIPRYLQSIQEACQRRDAQALRESAHTWKGSSNFIGAHQLAKHCSALERFGESGNVDGLDPYLSAFEAELQRVKMFLEMDNLQAQIETARG